MKQNQPLINEVRETIRSCGYQIYYQDPVKRREYQHPKWCNLGVGPLNVGRRLVCRPVKQEFVDCSGYHEELYENAMRLVGWLMRLRQVKFVNMIRRHDSLFDINVIVIAPDEVLTDHGRALLDLD